MLTRYLASIAASKTPVHESTWRQRFGDPVVELLLAHRILFPAGTADWYPCGGTCGRYRAVIEEGKPTDRPFRAVCVEDTGCNGVQVSAAELTLLGHSFTNLIDVLCGALAIKPAPTPELALTRNVHRLGTMTRHGVATDVFLAISPEEEWFPMFLATRAAAGRPTWFLATTLRWLPDSLLASHGPGARIEIAALADVIDVCDGKIVPREATPAPGVIRGTSAAAVAEITDRDGTRPLSREEHDDLVENASERFDLFVDTTEVRVGKRTFCVGGFREERGRYHETKLLPVEARGVAEFIERAREAFLMPEELAALKEHDAAQYFRKGWPKVDKLRRSIVRQKLGYRFQPRADLRWAVVKPIG